MLSITDTGTGISPEIQSQIFEPFFTTKEKGRGTGLGLATVYGVVSQSGGHIQIDSELGRGTSFEILLPFAHETAQTEREEPELIAHANGSEAVLVVEDDEAIRNMIAQILTDHGYSVRVAPDSGAAVDLATQPNEPIDLLLTDVVMPKMGGPELAARVRERNPHIKVLFMSGYTGDAILQHGVMESTANLLQKPFTPAALIQRIQETLRGE